MKQKVSTKSKKKLEWALSPMAGCLVASLEGKKDSKLFFYAKESKTKWIVEVISETPMHGEITLVKVSLHKEKYANIDSVSEYVVELASEAVSQQIRDKVKEIEKGFKATFDILDCILDE